MSIHLFTKIKSHYIYGGLNKTEKKIKLPPAFFPLGTGVGVGMGVGMGGMSMMPPYKIITGGGKM